MCVVAMVAEQAVIYLASDVDMLTGVGMVNLASIRVPLCMENHISNGGAASIGAVLPAGIREYCEIGKWVRQ